MYMMVAVKTIRVFSEVVEHNNGVGFEEFYSRSVTDVIKEINETQYNFNKVYTTKYIPSRHFLIGSDIKKTLQ